MADAILARCFSPLTIGALPFLGIACACVCGRLGWFVHRAEPEQRPHTINGERRKTCGSENDSRYIYLCSRRKSDDKFAGKTKCSPSGGRQSWFGHRVLAGEIEREKDTRFLLTSTLSFSAQRDQKRCTNGKLEPGKSCLSAIVCACTVPQSKFYLFLSMRQMNGSDARTKDTAAK